MKNPSDPSEIDSELQARIVALVLGEASDFEREQLQQWMRQQPALAAFHAQMQAVHQRLQGVADDDSFDPQDDWQLPAEQRDHVLAVMSGTAEPQTVKPVSPKTGSRLARVTTSPRWSYARVATALGVVGSLASIGLLFFMIGPWNQEAARSRTVSMLIDEPRPAGAVELYESSVSASAEVFDSEELAREGVGGLPQRDSKSEAVYERESNAALGSIRSTLKRNLDAPDAYYLKDDVQLVPSGPQFSLPQAAAPRSADRGETAAPSSRPIDSLQTLDFPQQPLGRLDRGGEAGQKPSQSVSQPSSMPTDPSKPLGDGAIRSPGGSPGATKNAENKSVESSSAGDGQIADGRGMEGMGYGGDLNGPTPAMDGDGQMAGGMGMGGFAYGGRFGEPAPAMDDGLNGLQPPPQQGPLTTPSAAEEASRKKELSEMLGNDVTSRDAGGQGSQGQGEAEADEYLQAPNPAPITGSGYGRFSGESPRSNAGNSGGGAAGQDGSELWSVQAEKADAVPVDGLSATVAGKTKWTDYLRIVPVVPTGLGEKAAEDEAFSTFSLHVSDVSFKLAQAALAQGELPEPAKIRIEEFVNAFDYGDPMPSQSEKVACRIEQAVHPFLQQRNLMRVSMRTAAAGRASSTPLRLTLLLDNSGSMERIDRQQTVRRAVELLAEQLTPADQVTLISFARQPRLLADQIPGDQSQTLVQRIVDLPSEGGTNLEAAIQLAFEKAQEQRLDGAQNRIVLLTDGAVNLGDANPERLSQRIITMRDAGIAFDAAGIRAEGLNDEILEALTRQGDGRYYLLDSLHATDDGFARQIAGALRPAAKNVKVQIEFNPQRVGQYKLLGFEKHLLNQEDFRNDAVDAAEMAAAEAGVAVYQFQALPDGHGDVGSVSVRFRDLSTGQMVENRWPIPYEADVPRLDQAAPSMQVAASAALLAAKLRGEPLGETVDLKTLANLLAGLPSRQRSASRVYQLQQMIEQTRNLASNLATPSP